MVGFAASRLATDWTAFMCMIGDGDLDRVRLSLSKGGEERFGAFGIKWSGSPVTGCSLTTGAGLSGSCPASRKLSVLSLLPSRLSRAPVAFLSGPSPRLAVSSFLSNSFCPYLYYDRLDYGCFDCDHFDCAHLSVVTEPPISRIITVIAGVSSVTCESVSSSSAVF